MSTRQLSFKKDEKIFCFHGPLVYEAKILKAEYWDDPSFGPDQQGPHYFVHYKGWKQTWDEWVPESRVLRYNETNIQRQKDLLATYANKKDDKQKDTTTKKNERKRPLPSGDKEQEYLKRPEIRIPIPDNLKAQLIDDWENVTKNRRLVSLPRSPTVAEILSEYKEYRSKQKLKDGPDGMLEEILEGLQIYFDKALGTILLYRYEREQYANILRQHSDKKMSEIYGAEHLLRLFGNVFHGDHLISVVQLPMLIAHTSMDQETILLLKEQLNLLIMYIQRNSGRLFLQEYENAAPEYVGTDS
ncbi:hypothetical protein MP638_002544 [Amoeboaphelidium occidentale]|nr:hypothetical protein MP638_002544 [Amoeboaphelidium occidentale]